MDHLPLPDNVPEHMAVPYLRGVGYDNQGFIGYDTRQGWNVQQLRRGDMRAAREEWNDYSQIILSQHEDAASIPDAMLPQMLVGPFVQNWLLYGVFQATLCRPIEETECLVAPLGQGSNETLYLTTSGLFAEFVSRRHDLSKDEEYLPTVRRVLDQAGYLLRDLDTLSEELRGFFVPGPTHLMLGSLVQAIGSYLSFWYKMPIMSSSVNRVRWLEDQLFDRGWCPNRVTKVRVELELGGLYYASLLPEAEDSADHTKCSSEVCVAFNIENEDLYVPRHRSSFCRCHDPVCRHQVETCACVAANVGSDMSEAVRQIVLQGMTPLVRIEKDGNALHYVITEFDAGTDYVAVSHVWSDGMGNPSGNNITACQAEYLSKCARGVLGQAAPLFWIDTLCVPRWPKEARQQALTRMDQAYRNARIVLVFSGELTHVMLPSTSDEILIRIAQSNWLTRLWTLQEGVLARELAFQFADKAVNFAYIEDICQGRFLKTSRVSHFPAIAASLMVSHMLSFHPKETRDGNVLQSLWFSIRHRATSKPKDEAVCAAILLGLSLKAIFAASVDEGMLEFWRTLKYVPTSILWVNGPRYMVSGARWAPKSLLDPRTWAIPIGGSPNQATVCLQGLRFQGIDGTYFPQIKCPLTEMTLIEFAPTPEDEYHVILSQNVGNPSWQELESEWQNIALLWNLESSHQFVQGVLVSVTSNIRELYDSIADSIEMPTHDIVVHAKWLAQVTVMRKGSDWDQMMSHMPTKFSQHGSPVVVPLEILKCPMTPVSIPKHRKWCLE